MSGVSILVPTVRVENIPQLRAWCFERSGLPARDIEFLFQVDEARRGLPRTLQQLIQASKNDLFIFLGDDCEPLQNFLRDALYTTT
jgi:hypothetical protein